MLSNCSERMRHSDTGSDVIMLSLSNSSCRCCNALRLSGMTLQTEIRYIDNRTHAQSHPLSWLNPKERLTSNGNRFRESEMVPTRLLWSRINAVTRPLALQPTPRHAQTDALLCQFVLLFQLAPPVALKNSLSAARSVWLSGAFKLASQKLSGTAMAWRIRSRRENCFSSAASLKGKAERCAATFGRSKRLGGRGLVFTVLRLADTVRAV